MAIFSSNRLNLRDGSVPWWTSCRFAVSLLCFFGNATFYALRLNISVAIVCMTSEGSNGTSADRTEYSDALGRFPQPMPLGGGQGASLYQDSAFDWSSGEVGWVLSAFFIGYIFTQFPGGILATKYGAKIVIGGSMVLMSLFTLLTPAAARISVYALMAIQFLKGFFTGVYFPSSYQLWGRWAPQSERAFLMALAGCGTSVGAVVSSILSGYLCENGFAGGWPSIFYIFGVIGLVFCVVWYLLAFSSPGEHPRITSAELTYIQSHLVSSEKSPSIPWRKLLRTLPAYGIFLTNFCLTWSAYVSLTYLPQYLHDVLQVDIESNGLYNSLPPMLNVIVYIVGAILSDYIVKKQLLHITRNRKLFQSLGSLPSAGIAIGVGFLTRQDKTLAIVMLTLWSGLTGFSGNGSYVNTVDMAPRFAAVLMGIDNTVAAIPGILVPLVTSAMTENGTTEEWQGVFFLCSGMLFFSWFSYMILGDATEQEWAKESLTNSEVKAEENPNFIELSKAGQPSYRLTYKRTAETTASPI